LHILTIGDGFPIFYGAAVRQAEAYCSDLLVEIQNRIGSDIGSLMAEPERGLADEAEGWETCYQIETSADLNQTGRNETVLASRLGQAVTRWLCCRRSARCSCR